MLKRIRNILIDRHYLSFAILLVGFGLAAFFWRVQIGNESRRHSLLVTNAAQERATAVDILLQDSLANASTLAGFIDATYPTSNTQFRRYALSMLHNSPSIEALSWVPRVTAKQRAGIEAARGREVPGFRVTEFERNGKLRRAAERENYYPAYYVEPLAGHERVLGFDVTSEPTRRQALELAVDSGQPVVSSRIKLLLGSPCNFGALIFAPVYRPDTSNHTVSDRRKNILGVTTSVVIFARIIQNSGIDTKDYAIDFIDESAKPGENVLYSTQSERNKEREISNNIKYHLKYGQRNWSISVTPIENSDAFSIYSWLVIDPSLTILIFSISISIYFESIRRRNKDLLKIKNIFTMISETIDEVFWIYNLDDGLENYVSKAYEEVWQESCESYIKNPASSMAAIHPKDQDRVRSYLVSSLETGRPFSTEYRITRPDGSKRWVLNRGFPVAGEDGAIAAFVGSVQDITDRKRSEQNLRRTARALRTLSSANGALVRSVSVDQLYHDMCKAVVEQGGNRMAWIGLAENDEAKTVRPVAWAGHVAGYLDEMQFSWAENSEFGHGPTGISIREGRAVATGSFDSDSMVAPWRTAALERGYGSSAALPLKSGSRTFGTLVIYAPEPDAFGFEEVVLLEELAANLAFGVDVLNAQSERHQIEAELFQARKLEAIGQLTGELAHDFNNILGIILTSSELGAREGRIEEARKRFEIITKASLRAADVTKSLLAVARRQRLVPREADVNVLITDLLGLITTSAGPLIEVRLDLADGTAMAKVDPAGFTTALLNLVINARDAMPGGGTLAIRTRRQRPEQFCTGLPEGQSLPSCGDYVVLEVDDCGIGMSPETRERAFEPFFTTKPEGEGAGLGLSAVYGFVAQLGGTATIESHPGDGTTVRLFFPAADGEAESIAPASQQRVSEGLKLLVVDDEPLLLEALLETLEMVGLDATGCASAELAVARLERERFDILISDMALPGPMNGLDLVRYAIGRDPTLRVLLISGYASRFSDAEATWPVLDKPFSSEALLAKLEEIAPQGLKPNPFSR